MEGFKKMNYCSYVENLFERKKELKETLITSMLKFSTVNKGNVNAVYYCEEIK